MGHRFEAFAVVCFLVVVSFARIYAADEEARAASEVGQIEALIGALQPDPKHPHDRFILVSLQEALAAKREGSGGIGACLVREATGEIIARGHNRQYAPHFRSDMHAEMDLLNRYEDALRITKGSGDPRKHDGIVLYSSVEPCPMCLTRIINTGLMKTYYAAADPTGGMVHKIADLPSFWKEATAGRIYAEAQCSPAMKEIAYRLFKHVLVKPQKDIAGDPAMPGRPDRSVKSDKYGDGWDYRDTLDHNAGFCVRGAVAVRINPMPAGYEEFDWKNGWPLVTERRLVIFGKGVSQNRK